MNRLQSVRNNQYAIFFNWGTNLITIIFAIMEVVNTYENPSASLKPWEDGDTAAQLWPFYRSEPMPQYRQNSYGEVFSDTVIYFVLWMLMLLSILIYRKHKHGLNLSVPSMLKFVAPPAIVFAIIRITVEMTTRDFGKFVYAVSRPVGFFIALIVMYAMFIKMSSIESNGKPVGEFIKKIITYALVSTLVLSVIAIIIMGLSSWASR